MGEGYKVTTETREKFLAVLAETGIVTDACEAISVSRTHMYRVRKADPEFEKAWDAAYEIGTDAMEDTGARRGVGGWEEPVFYQGVKCGTVRKFSDPMFIFAMKARRPDKYRERTSTELTGKGGGPIETRNADDLTDEQLAAIASAGRPTSTEPEKGEN